VPSGSSWPLVGRPHATCSRRDSPSLRRKRSVWAAALLLVVAGAAGIRLFRLDAEPFWLDEVCTYSFNAGSLADVARTYAGDVHPPLYGILLHGWAFVFGTSQQALRSYSTACSLLALVCTIILVRAMTGDHWAALAAGIMVAVNPFDIWHARDARMYEQATAIATMATCVLWHWLERDDVARPPRRHALVFGALAVLLLYTHYLGSLLLAAQLVAMLVLLARHHRWRDATYLVGATASALLLFAPWALYVFRLHAGVSRVVAQVGWIPRPTLAGTFSYLTHEFFLGFAPAPETAASWFPVAGGGLLAAAVLARLSADHVEATSPARHSADGLALMLWLALGPALFAATISYIWRPIYFPPRFALFCLAPVVVALFTMAEAVRPPLRTAIVATITALMAIGATWQATAQTKVGLRELREMAERFGEPDYALLFPSPHSFLVRYSLPHAALHLSREGLGARLRAGTPTTVWVCLKDGTLPPRASTDGQIVAWLANTGPYRRLGNADQFTVYELHPGACGWAHARPCAEAGNAAPARGRLP
jgi:uncharacterized membrane protein